MALRTVTFDDKHWQLVPKELPEVMRQEGFASANGKLGAQACWRRMLLVAPQLDKPKPASPCRHEWTNREPGQPWLACEKCGALYEQTPANEK